MYKVGDKVLVKATVEKVTDDYVRIYAEGYGERSFGFDNAPVEHKTYEQGLADAWELARKIATETKDGGIPCDDMCVMFGTDIIPIIFEKFTFKDCLAKIEAYEKEKEIKVGDEVVHGEGSFQTKFTVTFFESNKVEGFDKNGNTHSFCYPNPYIKKTGKHIDIESLLRQIGE